jgi:hypothetical protein
VWGRTLVFVDQPRGAGVTPAGCEVRVALCGRAGAAGVTATLGATSGADRPAVSILA